MMPPTGDTNGVGRQRPICTDACLRDVAQRSDRIRRRNALKVLEEVVVPKLGAQSALSLLCYGSNSRSSAAAASSAEGGADNSGDVRTALTTTMATTTTNGPSSGLARILLETMDDNETSESCREKAAVVFRATLQTALGGNGDGDNDSSEEEGKERSSRRDAEDTDATVSTGDHGSTIYTKELYAEFCDVLCRRLAPRSSRRFGDDYDDVNGNGGVGVLVGRASRSFRTVGGPAESSEEIRLLLVESASELLPRVFPTDRRGCCAGERRERKGDENESKGEAGGGGAAGGGCAGEVDSIGKDNDRAAAAPSPSCLAAFRASSALCRALASAGGLADPYPELKRSCCGLLIRVSAAFPGMVRERAVSLLRPIVGGGRMGFSGAGAAVAALIGSAAADPDLSSPVTFSCDSIMMRHRHAKTRCVALDATAAVLSCCGTNYDCAVVTDDDDDKGRRSENVLRDYVLPCWEDFPPFDRSPAVRLALVRAIGSVAIGSVKDFFVPVKRTERSDLEELPVPTAPRILVLLLVGISDESENVSQAASDVLAELAAAVLELQPAASDDDSVRCDANAFPDRDVVVADFVSAHSSAIVSVLLSNMSGKIVFERRIRAVHALEILIRLVNRSFERVEFEAGDSPTPARSSSDRTYPLQRRMKKIILALFTFFGDEEESAQSAAASCGRAIGMSNSSAFPVLELMLPPMRGESAERPPVLTVSRDDEDFRRQLLLTSPIHFSAALSLICFLVEGGCMQQFSAAYSPWLSSSLDAISATISSSRVLEVVSQDESSAWALLQMCRALLKYANQFCIDGVKHVAPCSGAMSADNLTASERRKQEFRLCLWTPQVIVNVLSCCFQLIGCPGHFGLEGEATGLLESVPDSHGCLDKSSLLRVHFRRVLEHILFDESSNAGRHSDFASLFPCTADDRRLLVFDALVRNSGGIAVGENFSLVAPFLERLLADNTVFEAKEESRDDASINYAVKLSAMALVETVVSDISFPKDLLHPFTTKLLDSVILPNLVWRVGGMASSLRKISAAALFSLLRNGGATRENLFASASKLLPVLKSNLGDDDASTRELIISSLSLIFELLPGALGEDAVHQLYPDLIRCLDDSNDNVRLSACGALKSFFKAASPNHFKGTAIEYMVEQLLIHLDDPERRYQMAVLDVLTRALDIDSGVVTKKTRIARASHRSEEFCCILLRKADERIAAASVMRGQTFIRGLE